ncbi:hypothetical protein CFB43_33515 [Burkholderia sp. AU15512]|nr:hypothetical protein CFB43_33515 [Burkholderia sp. AU15512]
MRVAASDRTGRDDDTGIATAHTDGGARRHRCGIDSMPVRGPRRPGRPLTQVNPIPHASHTVESNARAMPHATARRMRDGGGDGAGFAPGVFMPPAGGRNAMRCGAG